MAIFKLGSIFTAISGKIGGQSFSNFGTFGTIRNITQTNKVPSSKQSIQRNLTAFITNSWSNLTQTQRDNWNAASFNYSFINKVGDTVLRNGFGVYNFCNQNLSLIDKPLLQNPPLYVEMANPKINITDISSGNFKIQSNNASSDYLFALFGVANLPKGAKASKGVMRYIGSITAAQLLAGYDVVNDLQSVFGNLTFPNKMAITVDPINQTTGNRHQFVEIIPNNEKPFIIEVQVPDGYIFKVPFSSGGTYSGDVNFGDGTIIPFNAWNEPLLTHTYINGGTYKIVISGSFPKFIVANQNIKTAITDIIQFGTNGFDWLSFYGCSLLTKVSPKDTPNFIGASGFYQGFRKCINLEYCDKLEKWDVTKCSNFLSTFEDTKLNQSLDSWNMINITNMTNCFRDSLFNMPCKNWNLSSVTNMQGMFLNAKFNQDVDTWQVSDKLTNLVQAFSGSDFNKPLTNWETKNVTNMSQMLRYLQYNFDLSILNYSSVSSMFLFFQANNAFTTANYDLLLQKIVADVPLNNVSATFTNAKYTIGGAGETARNTLITTYSWLIADGGGV